MSDAIVYIVDDDAALGRSLGRLIRSVGLDVVTFTSAQEFLDHPRSTIPGCLVLDVPVHDTGLSGA